MQCLCGLLPAIRPRCFALPPLHTVNPFALVTETVSEQESAWGKRIGMNFLRGFEQDLSCVLKVWGVYLCRDSGRQQSPQCKWRRWAGRGGLGRGTCAECYNYALWEG